MFLLVLDKSLPCTSFPSATVSVAMEMVDSEREMIELTRANFKEVVLRQEIVLIECWAPGCGVCAQFDPVFAAVAEKNQSHTFARMNVITDEQLGEFFEIEHTLRASCSTVTACCCSRNQAISARTHCGTW